MLLIRNPISSTKKFFKKTIHSFKSIFSSPTYQKLPKTTPTTMDIHNPKPTKQTLTTTERIVTSPPIPSSKNNNKTMVVSSSSSSPTTQSQHHQGKLVHIKKPKKMGKVLNPNDDQHNAIRFEERRWFIAQKLRELEMVDMGNIDHKLDIEEVLHYYSRLTCQPYLELVDAFFMEIYAEFFDLAPRLIRSDH